MKIIHINNYSPSLLTKNLEQGIFDNWYARTAIYLKEYYPELEIECWTPERTYKSEKIVNKNGIKFRIFPSSLVIRYGREISLPLLKALAKEDKNTILHFHEYHSLNCYILCLLYGNKFKIIGQHHGGRVPLKHLFKRPHYFLAFPWLLAEHILERISLKKIKMFFVLNENEKKDLEKFIEPKKIKIQTAGVDFDTFKNINKLKARKKLNLPNKKIILFSGSLIKRKRVRDVIYAISKLDKDVLFVVIGDGPERKNLVKLTNNLRLNNKVEFVGYIDNYKYNKMPLYLSASDLFIMPSSWEGASVSIMEALACNIPVLTTNAGNAREIINKSNGVIIKIGDINGIVNGIKYIFSHDFKDIRGNARKIFDWRAIVRSIRQAYLLNK